MVPVIDAHCHIYPDKIASKASSAVGKFYDVGIPYDGRVDTLKNEVLTSGRITHNIVFSVATKPQQVESINNYIIQAVADHPGFMTGLGTMQQDYEEPEQEVERIIAAGLRGIKFHPDIQAVEADDPRLMRVYDACRGRIPVLLHTGDFRYDYSNPNRIKRILENFPDLMLVGAHFGGWSIYQNATEELFRYENFAVDCSSSFGWLAPELVEGCIRKYSAERVMFGSDYPMWNPESELDKLLELDLMDDEKEQILYKTACRVYNVTL